MGWSIGAVGNRAYGIARNVGRDGEIPPTGWLRHTEYAYYLAIEP